MEWKFLPFVTGMFENSSHAIAAAECALEQGPDVFEAMNHRHLGRSAGVEGKLRAAGGAAGDWPRTRAWTWATTTRCVA